MGKESKFEGSFTISDIGEDTKSERMFMQYNHAQDDIRNPSCVHLYFTVKVGGPICYTPIPSDQMSEEDLNEVSSSQRHYGRDEPQLMPGVLNVNYELDEEIGLHNKLLKMEKNNPSESRINEADTAPQGDNPLRGSVVGRDFETNQPIYHPSSGVLISDLNHNLGDKIYMPKDSKK